MGDPLTWQEARDVLTAPGASFEMELVDTGGRLVRAWKHAFPNLAAVLDHSKGFGDRVFLVFEDDSFTFDEHYRCAATFAHRLRDEFRVAPGDRVAIAMRNYPEWPMAFYGASAAGAVVVPLNAWWKGAELSYGLSDSGAKVLICDGERARLLDEGGHLEELRAGGLSSVIVVRDDAAAASTGGLTWDEALGDVDAGVVRPALDASPEDDATIFYTSGTTGAPKGALGTHRNICTNLGTLQYNAARLSLQRGRQPSPLGSGRQNAYLVSVPFFHATGCHSILLGNTAGGAKLVIMRRWDPERALELIERERITSFGGVPSMVWQVLDSPSFEHRDTSSVHTIGYGGAPAPPELVRRITEHFALASPSNGYGMTETSAITTSNAGGDYVRKPDSVGPPVPVCDVKVVDEFGKEQPLGEIGELLISGPNVVKGYWAKPEATEAAFVDGWIRTGDVARIDDEGFVFIVDRAKDMLIRGGENVYCVEVEGVLFEHPAVADCAVIGVPHEVLGEEVGAVVQLKAGAEAERSDLQRFVADRLAGFKVPTTIWFRDEPLPRNPAGKVLKRDLRQELVGG